MILLVALELGRYPIMHNKHVLAIKYWLRLKAGTKNQVLNEAYKVTEKMEKK